MSEDQTIDGREIADLLPFYAAGTLRADDRARVEAALAADPALRNELTLVREEQLAAIESSEALGAPSRRATERLLAMIDAAPVQRRGRFGSEGFDLAGRFDLAGWIGARLEALRPRTLAFGAMAACLLVAVQAGYIGLKMGPQRTATFQTASHEDTSTKLAGTVVVVSFAPNAQAADIGKLLDANRASIVAGPLAGGLYQVRISEKLLGTQERDRIIATLKASPAVVRFATPVSSAEPD